MNLLVRSLLTLPFLARPHRRPVFVLGFQKSGTTAIAALLAGMTGRSVTLDLRRPQRKGDHQLVRRGTLPFSRFIRLNRVDFSRDIIKDPNLSLFYPELSRHFPEARFVMVMRDPRDNLRSILNRLELPGHLPELDATHLAAVKKGWHGMLDGRWLGLSGDNYVAMIAARWDLIARTYLDHRDRMLLIRYEDFLRDKAGAIAELAGRLGWPPRHDIADKVDIQFQPRGNREVTWDDFFGPDNLRRIQNCCAQSMKALNYPLIPTDGALTGQ